MFIVIVYNTAVTLENLPANILCLIHMCQRQCIPCSFKCINLFKAYLYMYSSSWSCPVPKNDKVKKKYFKILYTTRNVGYPESGVKHFCHTPEIRIASAPIRIRILYLGINLGIILLGGKDYTFLYRDKRGYPIQIIWASLSLHKQRLYGSWKANFVGGDNKDICLTCCLLLTSGDRMLNGNADCIKWFAALWLA